MQHILDQRRRNYGEPGSGDRYQERIRGARGFHRLSHRLELAALGRALDQTDGSSVLDAPCGTGRIHGILKTRFSEVVSADASPEMLDVLRREHGTSGCCADVFNLPFPDASFDWVACHRFFHHLGDDRYRLRLLQSLKRVCRRGILLYVWLKTPFRDRRSAQRHCIRKSELVRLAREVGLLVTSSHRVAWPIVPKAVVVLRKPPSQ